jgi:hypothetical protein
MRPFAIESLRCGPHGRLALDACAEEFVLNNYLDKASALTLALTLLLFVIALFIKGFTHDLLLEAGVFLVSIKLVLAGYKSAQGTRTLLDRLDRIDSKLAHLSDRDRTMEVSKEKS